MKHLDKIQLNDFQLEGLLSGEEKRSYAFIMETNVFCTNCEETCPEGVEVESVWLNRFNDIHTYSRCRLCGNGVTRIVEFGEHEFFMIRPWIFGSRWAINVLAGNSSKRKILPKD